MPSTKQTQQNILKIIYFQQTNNSQLIKQKRENEIQRTYQNKREEMRREVEKGKNDGEGVMSGMTKRERKEE